jgi:hypothetical protein
MSVSSIHATTGTMAAAAAVFQAQAVQYSNHFGDLGEARRALSVFQKDSAVALANGYDPINQTAVLRQDFSTLKKALSKGDIRLAQATLSTLKKDLGLAQKEAGAATQASADLQALGVAVKAGNLPFAKTALASFGKNLALASANRNQGQAPLNSSSREVQDIRSLQVAIASGDSKNTSTTFIKLRPELASFAQSPLVFPTSGAAVTKLSVNTSTQAVLQSMAAAVFDGTSSNSDGTSFAPTPELILGSKGMTIPPGADLQISQNPFLLKGLSVAR